MEKEGKTIKNNPLFKKTKSRQKEDEKKAKEDLTTKLPSGRSAKQIIAEKAEDKAKAIRKKEKLDQDSKKHIDPVPIALNLGLQVMGCQMDIDVRSAFEASTKKIFIHENDPVRQKRVTLSRQIGAFLHDPNLDFLEYKAGCTNQNYVDHEYFAACFAGFLLLPKEKAEAYLELNYSVNEIQREIGVPKDFLFAHLRRTGLLQKFKDKGLA